MDGNPAQIPHPVETYYRRMLDEAAGQADQADYLALSQGEYGTELRHKAVVAALPRKACTVLDLGCGTGLLLERICKDRWKPEFYRGVDGMPEREAPLKERIKRLGIKGSFELKPMEVPFWHEPSSRFYAVALAVGLMGFYGLHERDHISSMIAYMAHAAEHGVITFPIVYGTTIGAENLMRWPVSDLKSHPMLKYKRFRILEREVVINW